MAGGTGYVLLCGVCSSMVLARSRQGLICRSHHRRPPVPPGTWPPSCACGSRRRPSPRCARPCVSSSAAPGCTRRAARPASPPVRCLVVLDPGVLLAEVGKCVLQLHLPLEGSQYGSLWFSVANNTVGRLPIETVAAPAPRSSCRMLYISPIELLP